MEQQNQPQRMTVKVTDEILKGVYSNVMQISHSKEEFWLDFLTIVPPQGTLGARVFISPGHFKRMINALEDNLKKYEEKFGSVKIAEEPKKEFGF